MYKFTSPTINTDHKQRSGIFIIRTLLIIVSKQILDRVDTYRSTNVAKN